MVTPFSLMVKHECPCQVMSIVSEKLEIRSEKNLC